MVAGIGKGGNAALIASNYKEFGKKLKLIKVCLTLDTADLDL